jgi:phage terminase small subunit
VSLLATPCYKPIANQLPNNKKDIKDKDWRKVKLICHKYAFIAA